MHFRVKIYFISPSNNEREEGKERRRERERDNTNKKRSYRMLNCSTQQTAHVCKRN